MTMKIEMEWGGMYCRLKRKDWKREAERQRLIMPERKSREKKSTCEQKQTITEKENDQSPKEKEREIKTVCMCTFSCVCVRV